MSETPTEPEAPSEAPESSSPETAAPTPKPWRKRLAWGAAILLITPLVVLFIAYHALKLPPPPSVEHLRDKSLVISHRGESARAPENTLESIQLASELGAKIVELDVSLSSDGIPILMHDCTLDRTVKATGEARQRTLADLQTLELKVDDPKYAKAKIPTLEAAIELCLKLGLMIEIELKGYYPPDVIVPKMLELYRKHDLYDKAWVASFYPWHLYHLRKQEPRILTAFLIHPEATDSWAINEVLKSDTVAHFLGVGLLRPYKTIVTKDYIRRWEAQGRVVNVWVINTAEEREAMKALDVAYSTDCFGGTCDPFSLEDSSAYSYHCLDEKPKK